MTHPIARTITSFEVGGSGSLIAQRSSQKLGKQGSVQASVAAIPTIIGSLGQGDSHNQYPENELQGRHESNRVFQMISLPDHPWLALVLGSLATHRLSLLVSKEDGPAFIFRKIRRLPDKGTATKKGLSCTLCVSMYAAAVVAWFFYWRGLFAGIDWPIWWVALSSASICLHMQFTTEIGSK